MSMLGSLPRRSTESPAVTRSPTLRVLIADDERLCRERLKRFLHSEPGAQIVAECASGVEALEAIRRESPDVAFLDVRMPELDAFGILEALQDHPQPAIILVTAFDQFALRAFEIEAVDYLLKPFDRQRFQVAFGRVRARLQLSQPRADKAHHSPETRHPHARAKPLERITVRSAGRITLVKPSDIDWISAADNYVELHIAGKVHLMRGSLSRISARLDGNRFARISRAILVNLDRVQEIRSKSHGDYFVILSNGTSLPGSRNYRLALDNFLVKAR